MSEDRSQSQSLALAVAQTAAEQALVYHVQIEANRLAAWKATPAAKRTKYVPELDRAHLTDTVADIFAVMIDLIRKEMAGK